MSDTSYALAEPMAKEANGISLGSKKLALYSVITGFCCAVLWSGCVGQRVAAQEPPIVMAFSAAQPTIANAAGRAIPAGAIATRLRKPGFVDGAAAPFEPRSRVVVSAKERNRMFGKGGQTMGRQRPQIPVPSIDPVNEEFVVFVRSTTLQMWTPCTMIKGNSAANQLVKQLGDVGNNLARDTMVRNLGENIYKNQKQLLKAAAQGSPSLKYATEVEWGFKIRDKTKPKEWFIPKNIIVLPPEGELPKAPIDNVANAADKVKEGFTNIFKR